MKREDHKEIIQKMLGMVTPDNQADASKLLTQLSEDYEETLTAFETASTNVQELTSKNETLREVNADLILKVGTSKKETDVDENNNSDVIDEENKMTFEALFNEKGELI